MSNFKKLQQKQERINKAVEKLVDYFGNEVSMNAFYHDQSQAQIEIMSMIQFVEMHIRNGIKNEAENVFCPNTVVDYLSLVNDIIKMLQPFADIAEEGWYVKD